MKGRSEGKRMPVKPTKGFMRFMKRNRNDQGRVGDLAKDLLFDPYLPRDVALSFAEIKHHLESKYSVGPRVIETLELAWELWNREKADRKYRKLYEKRVAEEQAQYEAGQG